MPKKRDIHLSYLMSGTDCLIASNLSWGAGHGEDLPFRVREFRLSCILPALPDISNAKEISSLAFNAGVAAQVAPAPLVQSR